MKNYNTIDRNEMPGRGRGRGGSEGRARRRRDPKVILLGPQNAMPKEALHHKIEWKYYITSTFMCAEPLEAARDEGVGEREVLFVEAIGQSPQGERVLSSFALLLGVLVLLLRVLGLLLLVDLLGLLLLIFCDL